MCAYVGRVEVADGGQVALVHAVAHVQQPLPLRLAHVRLSNPSVFFSSKPQKTKEVEDQMLKTQETPRRLNGSCRQKRRS